MSHDSIKVTKKYPWIVRWFILSHFRGFLTIWSWIYWSFSFFSILLWSTPLGRSLGKCCLNLISSIKLSDIHIHLPFITNYPGDSIPYNSVSEWSLQWFPNTFLGVGNARGLDVLPVAPYIAEPDTIPNARHSPWLKTVHYWHLWRSTICGICLWAIHNKPARVLSQSGPECLSSEGVYSVSWNP